jgi:catechol 2,3-dioxygenase-like lactoylglutathione lyase family enzyme
MEHVGIVVDDLAAATEFFVELGLKPLGEAQLEGGVVDRVVGLEGVRTEIAMLVTPYGHGRIELVKFLAPFGRAATGTRRRTPQASAISHSPSTTVVARLRARGEELVGEVERYEDSYRLCYVRGPEGTIIELAEQIN